MSDLNLSTLLNSVEELRDNSEASRAFRKSLQDEGKNFETFAKWIVESLSATDWQAKRALQDIVNALGKKLGFRVEYGTYERADGSGITFDGFWQSKTGNVFLIYNFTD